MAKALKDEGSYNAYGAPALINACEMLGIDVPDELEEFAGEPRRLIIWQLVELISCGQDRLQYYVGCGRGSTGNPSLASRASAGTESVNMQQPLVLKSPPQRRVASFWIALMKGSTSYGSVPPRHAESHQVSFSTRLDIHVNCMTCEMVRYRAQNDNCSGPRWCSLIRPRRFLPVDWTYTLISGPELDTELGGEEMYGQVLGSQSFDIASRSGEHARILWGRLSAGQP